jgi:hypothetical protein
MSHGEMTLRLFLFLLKVSLLAVTGMVLHRTEAGPVLRLCPALWETMALILVAKCLRLTLCAVAFKLIGRNSGQGRQRGFEPLDLIMHVGFFVTECIVTSRSLNSPDCAAAASEPFEGHPLVLYVNGVSCVWDGCYILSCALFAVINR